MAHPNTESGVLRSRPLRAAILALVLGLIGFVLVTFVIGFPIRYRYLAQIVSPADPVLIAGLSPEQEAGPLSRLGAAEAQALHALGFSLDSYAAYILFFDVAHVLFGTAIAALILLRKRDNLLALLIAYLVVLLSTQVASFVAHSLAYEQPLWMLGSTLLGTTGMVGHAHLFYLSPDGRFVPAWTRKLAPAISGLILGYALYSFTILPDVVVAVVLLVPLLFIWLGFLAAGIAAQVFRYHRISNPVQRQQSKWLAAGLTMTMVGVVLNVVILNASYQISGAARLALYLVRAPLVNACLMFFALSLAFSIFRYRLWDIDLLVRRTTSYAALTGFLAVLYFGLVVTIQTVFAGFNAGQSQFSIVLSTLVIAALFRPLQRRIQHFIDSRFYRTKYDAERTLAQFANTAQEEVDIDKLCLSLLGVVEKTIRPERTSLWIK